MNTNIFQDYPFGKYYVFDGRNNCYVLMNQDYSDFVAVIDFPMMNQFQCIKWLMLNH